MKLRLAVGVACYCFVGIHRPSQKAMQSLIVYVYSGMSVEASLSTSQTLHSKQPRNVSTAFTDHCFTVLTVGLTLFNCCLYVGTGPRDGTISACNGCVTVVKSSTIPICTYDLLYELRFLLLGMGLIEITRRNSKRV